MQESLMKKLESFLKQESLIVLRLLLTWPVEDRYKTWLRC